MERQFKHIFVTRNEFQELENLIPDTTATFLTQMMEIKSSIDTFNEDVGALKRKADMERVDVRMKFTTFDNKIKEFVPMEKYFELGRAIEERVHTKKFERL